MEIEKVFPSEHNNFFKSIGQAHLGEVQAVI